MYPKYYISIDLKITTSIDCLGYATMVEGRICACPEDMYFDRFYYGEHYWTMKCLPLPKTFYESELKLDIKYTYNGKTHVQHHQLVTKD